MRDQNIMNCQHLTKPGNKHSTKKRKGIVHGKASGELFASKGRDVNELFTNSFGITHLKYESTI